MERPAIPVAIPLLLGNATGGVREVHVTGVSLQECLDDLLVKWPLLRSHLYEEPGTLRRHVVIMFNGQNTRWLDSLDIPVKDGDRITVLQAVSGG